MHLHPLEFLLVRLVGDALAELLLLAGQVRLGELVDRLVQERRAAHGGLTHRQVEDVIGAELVGEPLLQGVLHQALGEHLRGVVAGGFLPVAPGHAVDELAFRVHAQGLLAVHVVVDAFVVVELFQLRPGDEVAGIELVRVDVLAPGGDLIELLGGEEAAVAEQRLVDGAQLVDAELGVADPAAASFSSTPRGARAGQRHTLDHPLQGGVAEHHPVEQRGPRRVEEVAVQALQGEGVGGALVELVALAAYAVALVDQREHALQAVVEVAPLPALVGGQAHHLQVAQALQAVALAPGVVAHGQVAQLRARLDVEQEEDAVHGAQALPGELLRVQGVLAAVDPLLAAAGLLDQLLGGLVAQQLDGLAQGVLEVVGDGEGVLVAVLVQAVQAALARVALLIDGRQALAVQQHGGGLEGAIVAAAEDLLPVEAQHAVLGPLVAVDEDALAVRKQQHPARRALVMRRDLAKHRLVEDLVPALPRQGVEVGALAEELPGVQGERERVLALVFRVQGAEHPEFVAQGGEHRQLGIGGHLAVVGLPGDAEHAHQLTEEVALLADALHGAALALEAVAQGEVALVEVAQGAMGRLALGLPGLEGLGQVALEHFGQVVGAEEFVVVGQANEGGGGVLNGHVLLLLCPAAPVGGALSIGAFNLAL